MRVGSDAADEADDAEPGNRCKSCTLPRRQPRSESTMRAPRDHSRTGVFDVSGLQATDESDVVLDYRAVRPIADEI